ncbi:MAG: hypothetical protein EOO20_18580 [Chryseobacterium sp.]|nr:MAG: hypothetical protein EOO20_18580 [Chryseobacterium sp.]
MKQMLFLFLFACSVQAQAQQTWQWLKSPHSYGNMSHKGMDVDAGGNVFTIVTDFAPSEPSKLMITMITENVLPNSPTLSYTATTVNPTTLGNVVFAWDKQAYKGKYYLYKMNEKGNWEQIAIALTDADLPLIDTDWGSDQLIVQDSEGNTVYHHFKMITENTAGMSSTDEIILTIPS